MKIKIQIGLWTIIGLLLYTRSNSTELNSTQMQEYLNVLCQTNGDCLNKERTVTDLPRRPNNTCCWECDDRNAAGHTSKPLERYTKCLFPTINSNALKHKFMYVVDPPDEGCIETAMTEKQGLIPSCSPDVKTVPWGNFYPVYSRDKKINFINENCAVCHGANDILKWKVLIEFIGQPDQLFHSTTNYYETFNSSNVFIMFEAPNDDSEDYSNVCLKIRDKCLQYYENFRVPVSINITKPEIIQACEQGPTSIYIESADRAYKNVFCAICNRRYSKISNENVQCEFGLIDTARKGDSSTLVSLLKDEFIDVLEQEKKQVPDVVDHLACLPNSKTVKEKHLCRTVLCPAIQVRYPDGTCNYPFKTMFIYGVAILINITSSGKFNSTTMYNLTATDIRSTFERFSPWSSIPGCLIIAIGYRSDKFDDSGSEFFISIDCQMNGGIDIRAFVHRIKHLLAKPWIIWIDDRKEFTQEILMHDSLSVSNIINRGKTQVERVILKPSWAARQKDNVSIQGLSVPIWNTVFTRRYGKIISKIKMSKLFYCDNIHLMPDDYTFHSRDFPLYLIRNDKYLLTNEYYTYTRDDGNRVLITCLEDTDFALIGSQNDASSVGKNCCVFVLVNDIYIYIYIYMFCMH